MEKNLQFDFRLDKPSHKAFIVREFDAELPLVWDAFTKAEILDQWWAPSPWKARTKVMDFKVGGRRFYAMVSPDGMERWSVQRYLSITPKTNFKMLNAFSDENEKPELPGSEWDFTFSEKDGRTVVNIVIWNESLERMEKMIEMGFVQGFTATLKQLDAIVENLH